MGADADNLDGLFAREARTSARAQLVLGAITAAIGGAIAGASRGAVAGAVFGGILCALGVFWIVSGVRATRTPWRGTAYECFGAPGPERLVTAQAVERQLAEPETHVFGKGDARVFVTREWFVCVAGAVFAVPLAQVMWCYPQTKRYSVNFLPVGEVSSFALYTSDGYHAQVPYQVPVLPGRVATDTLLEVLAARAPAAFLGYRPEWAMQWNSLHASVVAAFQKRRAALSNAETPPAS